MTTIHLLDHHAGHHRVKPTLRRRIADAFLSVWEWLRATECLLPPAPMTGIALVPPVPFGAVAQPAEDNPPATWDEIRADWLCEPDPAAVCDDVRALWDRIRADNPGLPGMRDCCLAFDNEPHWRDCEARDDTDLTDELRQWYAEAAPVPMSPDPAVTPFTGWQVPDGWQPGVLPGGRGLMRVGKQPWLTAAQPALGEPTPAGLPRLGEDPREPLPADRLPPHIAAYFDEQNRALALGPDGSEET